jgi:hypothetical protein
VQFGYSLGDVKNIINTIFLAYTGTSLGTDVSTITANFVNSWSGRLAAQVSHDLTLETVTTTDLISSTGVTDTANPVITGDVVAPSVTAGAAMVISFKVGRRYRGGHPRIYLPGAQQNQVQSDNTWSLAYIGAMHTAWTGMVSDVTTATYTTAGSLSQINISYFQGFTEVLYPSGRYHTIPKLRPDGPHKDPILSTVINPKVASQRRRNQQTG